MHHQPMRGFNLLTPRQLCCLWGVLVLASCAAPPLIMDEDARSGFAIYRSGRLSERQLHRLCREGVEEIVVLSGSGHERECRYRTGPCSNLRVRLDVEQRADIPLREDFLMAFDAWIQEARKAGRRILFRCRHGWHRTGRLAAYYRMRYQRLGPEEAKADMHRIGRWMWLHPYLDPQVEALYDYLAGRECSTPSQYCVQPAAAPAVTSFPSDACLAP